MPQAPRPSASRRSSSRSPRSSSARRGSRTRTRSSGCSALTATTSTRLWDEVADLFADDGTIEIGLDGIYVRQGARSRVSVRARRCGKSGLAEGELNEHMQLMPVVTVAPDGSSGEGPLAGADHDGPARRARDLGRRALRERVRQGGRRLEDRKKLHWFQSFVVPYEGGWARNADANGAKYVSDRLPPDAPPSVEYDTWPATYLPPFHFENPVTGE
jgi:hypothetical protein